jgi:gluconolactonase
MKWHVCWCCAVALAVSASAAEPDRSPSGLYKAEEIDGPKLTASGLVWWKDRLIIADRGGKRLLAFTPPDKFETFKELKNPVGVAVDRKGDLIVTEKDIVTHLLRIKADGSSEEIATEGLGSPHFVTVHKSGTIYWSGFPDGGTRSLKPDGQPIVHQPRIGHTYGIGLAPKQDWLYVSSKLPNADGRAVWRFAVAENGDLEKGEVFFKVQDLEPNLEGLPAAKDGGKSLLGWVGRLQGLTVDSLGNIYIAGAESHTSGEAVAVISPDGKKVIAMILGVPRNISCMAFGGSDGRTLFITGAGEYRLHQVRLPVTGR